MHAALEVAEAGPNVTTSAAVTSMKPSSIQSR